jgi:uncharacterized membrane protein
MAPAIVFKFVSRVSAVLMLIGLARMITQYMGGGDIDAAVHHFVVASMFWIGSATLADVATELYRKNVKSNQTEKEHEDEESNECNCNSDCANSCNS